jgi:titin
VIQGDNIGTDVSGWRGIANGQQGVCIALGASFNTVGGTALGSRDLISGNAADGVLITGFGTDQNDVIGDLIGTNLLGSGPVANGLNGVLIDGGAQFNGIGQPGAGDVISGNTYSGVVIMDPGTSSNWVMGCHIGTDYAGLTAVPNGIGVAIQNQATHNEIGGIAPGYGNLISGNTAWGSGSLGVLIRGGGTMYNGVQGNLIGTDVTGRAPLGNAGNGVQIDEGASDNFIGASSPDGANVISGNAYSGVVIAGYGTMQNDVESNDIGTDSTGTVAVPNTYGVAILNGASFNLVTSNTIADESIGVLTVGAGIANSYNANTFFNDYGAVILNE